MHVGALFVMWNFRTCSDGSLLALSHSIEQPGSKPEHTRASHSLERRASHTRDCLLEFEKACSSCLAKPCSASVFMLWKGIMPETMQGTCEWMLEVAVLWFAASGRSAMPRSLATEPRPTLTPQWLLGRMLMFGSCTLGLSAGWHQDDRHLPVSWASVCTVTRQLRCVAWGWPRPRMPTKV